MCFVPLLLDLEVYQIEEYPRTEMKDSPRQRKPLVWLRKSGLADHGNELVDFTLLKNI